MAASTPVASVLIPTREPGPGIETVLEAVYGQRAGFPFEVVIVDSGSSPDELARMRRFAARVYEISPMEFGHGKTRNLLAGLARAPLLLYLSHDAQPASAEWMSTLIRAIDGPRVAGAYARQVPRPDADPLIRYFLSATYGPRPAWRRIEGQRPVRINEIFFSNVSSVLRRDVWERIPFREDVVMSEDQYWAYDALCAGYEVRYEPAAQVVHSHNYTLRTLYARNWLSGRSLRGLIVDSRRAVFRRGLAYVMREALSLIRQGQAGWLPYMLLYEATRSAGFALGAAGLPPGP